MAETQTREPESKSTVDGSSKLDKLRWLRKLAFWIVVLASFFVVFQLVLIWANRVGWGFWPGVIAIELTYVALFLIVPFLIVFRWLRHEGIVRKGRLADKDEVEALLVEAKYVEARVEKNEGNPDRPKNWKKKYGDLQKERERVEKLDPSSLTEYQILALDQMLVEFLKVDDLVARARSRLETLKEYADDTARDYGTTYYAREFRIESSIESIENKRREVSTGEESGKKDELIDDACVELRANLVDLLDHTATFDMNWAEGSAIIRGIILTGVISILPLMAMGILPILYAYGHGVWPCEPCVPRACLFVYNWGFLGIAGAITAVLRSLHKSDLVEVGDTKGKMELWRAVLSAGLGLVAGVLAYSMIAGELLMAGGIVPNINSQTAQDLGLSIVAAFSAGFFFESVFDKLKISSIGSN